MTHSTLLRVFSYLGFRASRKILGSNSIPVFPSPIPVFAQSRIQSRDCRSPLLIVSMGQASSSIRGYGGADENRSKEGSVDKNVSANVSQDEQKPSAEKLVEVPEAVVSPDQTLNPSHKSETDLVSETRKPEDVKKEGEDEASARMSQDEQKPSAEELVEVPEAVVSPEQTLNPSHKLETDLVSEASKKEDEDEAEKALKLALEELGEPPERPLAGDCCGQGCDVCVWDTYNDELRDYLTRRKALLKKFK